MNISIEALFGMIVGLVFGLIIGYGACYVKTQITIKTLQNEKNEALLAKNNMKEEWSKAINKLNKTETMLKDTLSAIEVLKMYQAIDKETREKLSKLKNTYDDNNNPTDNTYDEFRKMIEDLNDKNSQYNKTTATSDVAVNEDNVMTMYNGFIIELIGE